MSFIQILILAVVQGAAELLPVSSSAHVIAAEKLLGIDPSTPEMTFFLVMLHTGTMLAVILYFWPRWKASGLFSKDARIEWAKKIILATGTTGVVGYGLKFIIEKVFMGGESKAEIEMLFKNFPLIAAALFAAGLLIFISGSKKEGTRPLGTFEAIVVGAVQGLCLPFRGFSRSGATISTGLFLGVKKAIAEDFSFVLAVVLTPPVILHELKRLLMAKSEGDGFSIQLITPGLVGMVFSFIAGWFALKLLSNLIENGKWKFFGFYCWFASAGILAIHFLT